MTTDEIKQYLSQYYYLSQKVDSLKEEYHCLEILADGTQGISYEPKVQKQPSGKAPFIRYLDKLEKKRKQIDEKIEELLNLKEEIEEAIATVNDPVMELVLTYRYINCYDWNGGIQASYIVNKKLGYIAYSEDTGVLYAISYADKLYFCKLKNK